MANVLSQIFLVIYIIITILMTATLILRSRDAGLEYDGTRYWVDNAKYKVHLACVGQQQDFSLSKNKTTAQHTILIESAETPSEYDFEHWAYAAWKNGTINRYCYWDRPGYAWSDNASPTLSRRKASKVLSSSSLLGTEA